MARRPHRRPNPPRAKRPPAGAGVRAEAPPSDHGLRAALLPQPSGNGRGAPGRGWLRGTVFFLGRFVRFSLAFSLILGALGAVGGVVAGV